MTPSMRNALSLYMLLFLLSRLLAFQMGTPLLNLIR